MKIKWVLVAIICSLVLFIALRSAPAQGSPGVAPTAPTQGSPGVAPTRTAQGSPGVAPTRTATVNSTPEPAAEAEPDTPEQAETKANPRALTLNDALAIACTKSPLILEAEQAIKSASGFTIQTRSQALPVVELSVNGAQADKYNTSNPTGESDEINVPSNEDRTQPAGPLWSVQLKLVKTIFDAGETRYQIGAAKVSEAMATYAMEDTVQNVNMQIRQLYYQVLYERQRINIYRDAVALLEKQSQRVKSQMRFGGSNEFYLLRAQAGVDSLEPQEVEAQTEYETAMQQLADLLGMDYREAEDKLLGPGVRGKLFTKVDAPSLDAAIQDSVQNRPAIHQLEMAVEAERLDMRAEAAAYYPKVNLFGALGHSDTPAPGNTTVSNNNDGYIVGLSATWNIFDGGLVKGRVMQARAAFATAVDALQAARDSSEFTVREALNNLAFYQRDVNSHGEVWERARKCDNVAIQRAAAGTGTIFDLIQTLQITTATRAQLLNQLYQLNAIHAQIDYLTGRGVQISSVK